jgi:hypothetical protein
MSVILLFPVGGVSLLFSVLTVSFVKVIEPGEEVALEEKNIPNGQTKGARTATSPPTAEVVDTNIIAGFVGCTIILLIALLKKG